MDRFDVYDALPAGWEGLFVSGLLRLEIVPDDARVRDAGGGHAAAWSSWDPERQGFTLAVRADLAERGGPDAVRAMVRHEVAHILLGHFRHQCRRECGRTAEEAEANHCVGPEGLDLIDALMREVTGNPELASVRPEHIRAAVGLAPDLPPLYAFTHPRLHASKEEQSDGGGGGAGSGGAGGQGGQDGHGGPDHGEGAGGSGAGLPAPDAWCGGVSVDPDQLAAAAAAAAAIGALEAVRQDLTPADGWGAGSLDAEVAVAVPQRPPWVEEVMAWLQRRLEAAYELQRTRRRPRIDFLRRRVYLPDTAYELVPREVWFGFAVDTSGSMLGSLAYVELAVTYLLSRGGRVRYVAGDTGVLVDREIPAGQELPRGLLRGGGGTDIRPIVDRAASYRPKALVVFTDGEFPDAWWPERPEEVRDVLWVVPEGVTPPYGDTVRWRS